MIEEKLNEACNIVIGQLILLYEPLWELPRDRSVSHRHVVRGLCQCFVLMLHVNINYLADSTFFLQYFFLHTAEIGPSRHVLLVHILACTDIVAVCESGLNTCSEPHRLSACVAEWAAYAGDRGSNPAARTILVVFYVFIFYIRPLKSVFHYSIILSHFDFDSRFFVFAKLSLDLAVHATVWFTLGCMQNKIQLRSSSVAEASLNCWAVCDLTN